ncbi:DUF3226 domain-containing protein [Corallococcus exercitus]|uniref:DUF3226 domain-containing protein n=1 Tax=Corallococcus exercitus TaxID=2316736 RepID=UPI0035D460E9
MPSDPARVLLVEGKDDEQVIYHLCNHHDFKNKQHFEVESKDGYERLRRHLRTRPRTHGVETIGVVIDADENLLQRWKSVCEALEHAGYTELPGQPDADGVILSAQGDLPRIGIWMMPNNQLTGILEDFLQQLVAYSDALLPAAFKALDSLPEQRFKPTYRSKAAIHTWLAWQEEPGTPLGQAVAKRYLQADHELAQRFMTWLKRLFVTAPESPAP